MKYDRYNYLENFPDLLHGACFALIRISRCLLIAEEQFRMSLPNSLQEDYWWDQYEHRWAEIELYREWLSDEVIDLTIAHARSLSQYVMKKHLSDEKQGAI